MKVAIVGGCGHVGLPLALSLADAGITTVAYDISSDVVARVNGGMMPFRENGAEPVLSRVLVQGTFRASDEPSDIRDADVVILVIGTPVDDHLNPDPNAVVVAVDECLPYMQDTKLVILRSTVFPGVTARVQARLRDLGLTCDVAFCPERIVEGQAMHELRNLPQIVGAWTDQAASMASELFEALGVKTVRTLPEEAELAKLFTNTWRYIKFAAANQFWLMANEAGLDFARIRDAIRFDYPRASDMPGPGFAAGPCLFKDTMQLAAFTNNNFTLGHAAMMVNEGQPLYVVNRIAERFDLPNLTVGILGMAFKADSDDIRSSLSYKLKRILKFRSKGVLCTDPYVSIDPSLIPLDKIIAGSDVLVIAAPHDEYRDFKVDKPVVDIWNLRGNGSRI